MTTSDDTDTGTKTETGTTDTLDADATTSEGVASESPGRGSGLARRVAPPPASPTTIVMAVVSVVALLVVACAVLLVHERGARSDQKAVDAARAQAIATVKKAGPVLLSYDYRSLDKNFKAGLTYTDGEFRKQYQQTTTKVVAPVAVQYKAVVRAEMVEIGASSVTRDQVIVIAFVNQVTTSTRVTGTKLDQSRVRLELRRKGNDWKVVAVQAL